MGTKAFVALIAGLSAGTLIGILIAPDSGHKTRRKLAAAAIDFADSLKASFADLTDELQKSFAGKGDASVDGPVDEGKKKEGGEIAPTSFIPTH